jgi:hypothetical protein
VWVYNDPPEKTMLILDQFNHWVNTGQLPTDDELRTSIIAHENTTGITVDWEVMLDNAN